MNYVISKNNMMSLNYILMTMCLILISIASPFGYQSYIYTFIIFIGINSFCQCEYRQRNFAYFHFYLIIALCMFFIHRYQLPNYMGLTGPEGGIGTDDVRYYAGLPGVSITYSTERMDIAESNPYTQLINYIYPFTVDNPVEIVIFNILGIAFLPYLTKRTADVLLGDSTVSAIAERLILFCPFMMSIGLIIMRDVICSSIILVAFVCFAKKKYVVSIVFIGLLAFLKFGFVVFLGVILMVYIVCQGLLKTHRKLSTKLKYVCFFIVCFVLFAIFVIPNLETITGGRLSSESLFRDSFLEYLEGANEGSILVKLYALPVIIRIPALIITFLVIPPLTFNIFYNGVFIPRAFFQNVLAPIYWWPLFLYFFSFLFSYRKLSIRAKSVFYIIVIMALALGMISLQTRHKAALLPFFYIAIAYSIKYKNNLFAVFPIICNALFIIAQLVYCYNHFLSYYK